MENYVDGKEGVIVLLTPEKLRIFGGTIMEFKMDLQEIVKQFKFTGSFLKAEPCGNGHINSSYAVYFDTGEGNTVRYVLQKINVAVFKRPEELMENIENITTHIRKKVIADDGDPQRETLTIIQTIGGKSFYKSEEGEYWRSYHFIEDTQSYQLVENPNHFYHSGKAFGRFQQQLADFPADKLYETIPDFHHTEKRYDAFLEAVRKDAKGRAKLVESEIRFVLDRGGDTKVLVELLQLGKLPLRVTHNDTKFNNVLIDNRTGEGVCVIDLDTVMPGSALYDFGDSIRSGATTAEEDEVDLNKVGLDLDLFQSFTKGFLEAAGGSLTETELEYLPFSAKLLTLECGMRFLTDYLNGDVYFRIHRENHNLDRARNQFKLVLDMEQKFPSMQEIIKQICSRG